MDTNIAHHLSENSYHYPVGSLIYARGREWIVQPDSTNELLIVKPIGGSDEEITGILTALEEIRPASFKLPEPSQMGDYLSCKLLREALRLGFRNSAGPFRSFGRLAVEPRPYQLVPLIMALKLNPVRLLIADDVGVGKTIEACLIARELLDRGEISRFCVLCPPHLAEQWQMELSTKFNLEAELVLSNTIKKLENRCKSSESVFETFPYTVVSIDYIKSDSHKAEFLRTAPELIIVDEAHTASSDPLISSRKHQRYELVKKLSEDLNRHLIFVTATPHSGNEQAFKSLLAMLNKEIEYFPLDFTAPQNEKYRKVIAQHFIQRRRDDIKNYLAEITVFPESISEDQCYELSEPYKKLFDKALNYAREMVKDENVDQFHRRVRWWSALSLLRALASSPAAAKNTMLNRSPLSQLEEDVNAADEIALRTILDTMDFDATEATDILPGSDISENTDDSSHRKLLQMAKEAESLFGDNDYKLLCILDPIKKLLKDGYSPIIFCRFIETANYLTEQLKERLDIPDLNIVSVTGLLPPKEREMRINELSKCEKRILVCTDCLSEGINLQDHFNAVIHYDLSWNPTRHEQREGRVDRFGQPSKVVKLITYFGIDNQIDGIVLDVLIRKHRQIKASLGVSVPIPTDVDKVIEAIFEGLLLKEKAGSPEQLLIEGFNDIVSDDIQNLHKDWEKASEREKESRSLFAQSTIKVEEIAKELNSIRESIGTSQNIKEFLKFSLILYDAIIKEENENYLRFDLSSVNQIVKENCNIRENDLKIAFQLPIQQNEIYVTRTHPIVEGLSNLLITSAIDDNNRFAVAKRCGVFRTSAIQTKTVLLLLRYRFHLIQYYENQIHRSLVEDSQILAFTGPLEEPHWLNEQEFSILLDSRPTANVLGEIAYDQINKILEKYPIIQPRLEEFAKNRAQELLESHLRVRNAALFKAKENPQIEPIQPPDLLGIYVYLPQIGVII